MRIIFKENQIPSLVKKILGKISKITKEENRKNIILALSGDLGSGKTTLTKEIAKQLGATEDVISPTFVIMKTYPAKNSLRGLLDIKKIVHIDTYRLENEDDIFQIGWKEVISEPSFVIIEWPELIQKYLPKDVFWVKLRHIDKNKREVELLF